MRRQGQDESPSVPLPAVTAGAAPDPVAPDLAQELACWQQGYRWVAGLDEAGRGALAGPVTAAAVVVPVGTDLSGVWAQVRDSKTLTPARRQGLARQVQEQALAWAVGHAAPREIDALGIAAATRLAMYRALQPLTPPADYLLIDWVQLSAARVPQVRFARGDRRIVSIAAASILAKVARDQTMVALARSHPDYGFEHHKGYGVPAHLSALERLGPCSHHRFTFAPIARQPTLFDMAGPPRGGEGSEP